VAGKEIVQVYVRDVESTAFRPDKELKGFEKVALEPGETAEVTIELDRRAFAFYDPGAGDWVVESGMFEVLVGASATDIRLLGKVEVVSCQSISSLNEPAVYHDFPKGKPVNQADFESLLGRPVPPNEGERKGEYTINTPLGDMNDSFIARQLQAYLERQMGRMIGVEEDTPTALLMRAMVKELPLRGVLMISDGAISREMLDALIAMINGRIVRGAGRLISAITSKL
jgi:beta-glucosidase